MELAAHLILANKGIAYKICLVDILEISFVIV